MEKALFCWSGGKESAMALYEVLNNHGQKVVALLTTVTEDYDRISMHGVRRALLEQQADSLGLPIEEVLLSKDSSNEEYERKMQETLTRYKADGVASVVFGDVSLEDLREHRETKLAEIGMKGIFPLWKRDTTELAGQFMGLGFKAIVTCVDSDVLDGKFAGRTFDDTFLSELPADVDPCGENGEFHSFVYDGPVFNKPVQFKIGKTVLRENRFYYCDLMPAD